MTAMPFYRTLASILAVLAAATCLRAEESGRRVFTYDRFNDTYRDLVAEPEPFQQGALTVRVASPSNTLILRSNAIELEPQPDGSHRFRASASFLGKARVIAELDAGGTPGQMEDEVVLPPQELVVEGRALVSRVPEGWEITPLELPEFAEITIQSRLGSQLVSWCELMSVFTPGLSCQPMLDAFSKVRIPLPAPGEPQLLDASYLDPDEVAAVDAYLEEAARRTAAAAR